MPESAVLAPPAPAPPPAEVATVSVADDLGCLECSYNLRGLAKAGRCPECGCPVARSMDAGAGLRRAATAMRWAACAGLANIFAVVLLPFAAWAAAYAWSKPAVLLALFGIWLIPMAAAGVMAQAVRLFRRTGPLADSAEFGPPHRRWRNAVAATFVVDALLLACSIYDYDNLARRPILGWMLTVGYLWMPALVAVLYCSPARRLGNAARMERRANWFRSVSRMLVIGAIGVPIVVQFLPKNVALTTGAPAVLLALMMATPAAFLVTGAFYFAAAGFWLAKALHDLPPTADEMSAAVPPPSSPQPQPAAGRPA